MYRYRAVPLIVTGVLLAIGGCLLLASVLLFRTYDTPSEANSPTLPVGGTVWAVRTGGGSVDRGEHVVFDDAERPIKRIMRVVAIGGDTVESDHDRLSINGVFVTEDYLAPGTKTANVARTAVPEGSVFVLGDNRTNAKDSRFGGPVPLADVTDRVVWTGAMPRVVLLGLTAGVALLFVIALSFFRRQTRIGAPRHG